MPTDASSGPLVGTRVILAGGIGPAPFAAMLLGDLGADVVRIDRPSAGRSHRFLARSQRAVVLDLQQTRDAASAAALIGHADILIEGFRPGVMERLGLGPDEMLAKNRPLVYGRITGWGQSGPLAGAAGHDVNYLALSGALHAIGTADEVVIPLNLVADFGGGALYLCMGVLAALTHARATGCGQVVDSAMLDGAASLMHLFYEMKDHGKWGPRGQNLLDGAAPFYSVYRCSDDHWISIGAIEPGFYALLCEKLGLPKATHGQQGDPSAWPAQKAEIARLIRLMPRSYWCELLEGTDACFAPVMDMSEAPLHPHNVARGTFVTVDGNTRPAPAPRFSETPLSPQTESAHGAWDPGAVLLEWCKARA